MDIIKISKMSFFAYHGVLPEERDRGQEFLVTVEMETDFSGININDDLSRTYNYADAVNSIKKIMTGKPVNLLETLAEKIALGLLGSEKISGVTVTVEKPRPPLPVVSEGTSVIIYRKK